MVFFKVDTQEIIAEKALQKWSVCVCMCACMFFFKWEMVWFWPYQSQINVVLWDSFLGEIWMYWKGE